MLGVASRLEGNDAGAFMPLRPGQAVRKRCRVGVRSQKELGYGG